MVGVVAGGLHGLQNLLRVRSCGGVSATRTVAVHELAGRVAPVAWLERRMVNRWLCDRLHLRLGSGSATSERLVFDVPALEYGQVPVG